MGYSRAVGNLTHENRVSDPHRFKADPDPAFFLNAIPDPDPGFEDLNFKKIYS
jgi:hypothetical protein